MPSTAEVAPLEFLQLVAEPHRWRLLTELTHSDRRVGELTELLAQPQNLVSYHLAELRKAGLVSARRSSFDGRDTYYRVEPERCGDLISSAGAALQPGLRVSVDPLESIKIPGRRPPRVLFLCTGNSSRSPMAEALIEHLSGRQIKAFSAGSDPKPLLHPNTVRVLAERGIDIVHRPKKLTRFTRTDFDRVITLCDKVREVCPEFPGGPTTAHWSVADPSAGGDSDDETYAAFERTADDLEIRVRQLIAQITEERGGSHGR